MSYKEMQMAKKGMTIETPLLKRKTEVTAHASKPTIKTFDHHAHPATKATAAFEKKPKSRPARQLTRGRR